MMETGEESLQSILNEFTENVFADLAWLNVEDKAKRQLADWIVFFSREYWKSKKLLTELTALPSSKRRDGASKSCRTKVGKLANELREIMVSEDYEAWRLYMEFGAWSASRGEVFFEPEGITKALDALIFAASNSKNPKLKVKETINSRRRYCSKLRDEFTKMFPNRQRNVAYPRDDIGKLIQVFLKAIGEPLGKTALRDELHAISKTPVPQHVRNPPTNWLDL